MTLFDLHSDTLYEADRLSVSPISSSRLQAPLGISPFDKTHRLSAIWCDNTLDDEACFDAFCRIHHNTEKALSSEGLPETIAFTYAVEDARLLSGNLDRLAFLYEKGVRVLTLTWQGISSIGGAWDSDAGLSDFGKAAVRAACEIGMILDLSHASDQTAKETLRLTEQYDGKVIATHSNSRTVCPHKRNVSDYLFEALAERSSLVGISLVPDHLEANGNACLDTPLLHIANFLSLKNGDATLAIGSDFDGVDRLPEGITSLCDLPKLYHLIDATFGKALAKQIFSENAARYFAEIPR